MEEISLNRDAIRLSLIKDWDGLMNKLLGVEDITRKSINNKLYAKIGIFQ